MRTNVVPVSDTPVDAVGREWVVEPTLRDVLGYCQNPREEVTGA